MTTTELLAEVEKLPGEWLCNYTVVVGTTLTIAGWSQDDIGKLILDLHLRHIAERLASEAIGVWPYMVGGWIAGHDDTGGTIISAPTYAEALVAAAREVANV